MRRKIIDNVKITPSEVKEHFDAIPKDSLPFYESEFEVSEIVVYPKANRDVESYVTHELNEFKRQVEAGTKNFDLLARQYTEDPGSKETGGQYSLNRNDKIWDPTFLSAAFKLKEGQISPVLKVNLVYILYNWLAVPAMMLLCGISLKFPRLQMKRLKNLYEA